MQKMMLRLEIGGIFFVIVGSVFLQNVYDLCGHTLIGIMFGSVNDSIWETVKTILLPYLLWAMIELLCVHPPFHKFVAAKVISLYFLGTAYIVVCLLFSAAGTQSGSLSDYTVAVVSIVLACFLSYRGLLTNKKLENLFAPCVFLLLLFVALFCSFTPFPPQNYIFMDRATHFYGLIPSHIDGGDIVLDTLYSV